MCSAINDLKGICLTVARMKAVLNFGPSFLCMFVETMTSYLMPSSVIGFRLLVSSIETVA